MNKITFLNLTFSFVLVVQLSCVNNDTGKDDSKGTLLEKEKGLEKTAKIIEPVPDKEILVLEKDGIVLTEVKSPYVPNAVIKLKTKRFEEGKNRLDFSVVGVDNYAVSMNENNYTITNYGRTTIDKEFFYANNVFLAFLTYPNGISIKSNTAHVLKNVTLGEDVLFEMDQPHLFYCSPFKLTQQPTLDFYLVNTSISEKGNKVKVTINGIVFILSKWAAYKISGLYKKENTIRIQLVDNKGNLIEGPFNDSGDRKFQLEQLP